MDSKDKTLTVNELIKHLVDLNAKEKTIVRVYLPNDGAVIGLTADMLKFDKGTRDESFIIDLSDFDDDGDKNNEEQ